MKKLTTLMLLLSLSAFASKSDHKELENFLIKLDFEQMEYKLKLEKEKLMTQNKVFKDLNFLDLKNLNSVDLSCVEWVYRGSASRTEAIKACRGVTSMECLEWVYRGSASREESARACQYNRSMECAEWVYRGPSSREESVAACRGVTDMECVEFAYRGSSSREESARACGRGGRRPRPGDRPRCK